MESGVSDSRSIRSQAHMRRERFHSRTKSDFPAASPQTETLFEFLTLHSREAQKKILFFYVIVLLFKLIFRLHFLIRFLSVWCKFMVVVQLLLYIIIYSLYTTIYHLFQLRLRPSWIVTIKKKNTLSTLVCSSKARSCQHWAVCQVYSLMVVGCHWWAWHR